MNFGVFTQKKVSYYFQSPGGGGIQYKVTESFDINDVTRCLTVEAESHL